MATDPQAGAPNFSYQLLAVSVPPEESGPSPLGLVVAVSMNHEAGACGLGWFQVSTCRTHLR